MSRFGKKSAAMQKTDYNKVFAENEKSGDGMFLVLARRNSKGLSRLGLAIAKKHTPKAVQRNRIKRLIRESFRNHQPFSVSMDTVVINRSGVASRKNAQIAESLSRHWKVINRKLNRQESGHG